MAMTFDEFVKKYKGKGINFDKLYGVQCFDLANQFNRDVVGCGMFIGLHAYMIYTNFDSQPVKKYFTKIANTPSFVPKKGDIVVWGKISQWRRWSRCHSHRRGQHKIFLQLRSELVRQK